MNRIVYFLTLLFFVLTVCACVCTVIAEFNRMVCPASPVRVFNLKAVGNQAYRVEFLGEDASMRLPESLTRVEDFVETGKVVFAGAKQLEITEARKVCEGWCSVLQRTGGGLVTGILERAPAAAGFFKNSCKTGGTEG
ncbi:MAG: hypothetical protein BWY80_01242 [Firmicutes bacterium ADurb.Bin456]|nr:MAG: hypothetical protein BWY80_01242 [Firmicutes bacterium ADurb.Bin456]